MTRASNLAVALVLEVILRVEGLTRRSSGTWTKIGQYAENLYALFGWLALCQNGRSHSLEKPRPLQSESSTMAVS